jgi:hypothetical protein
MASPSGELRCAVQACLHALAQGIPELAFEIVGVKAVRAFDANVIIVSLAVKGLPGAARLVGSYLAGQNLPRGAALATLNAVNRVITRPAGA